MKYKKVLLNLTAWIDASHAKETGNCLKPMCLNRLNIVLKGKKNHTPEAIVYQDNWFA